MVPPFYRYGKIDSMWQDVLWGNPCSLMMEFSYCLDCIFSSSPLWLHGNTIYEVRHNSLIVPLCCRAVHSVHCSTLQSKHFLHLLGKGSCQQDFPASGHMLQLSLRWVFWQTHKQTFLKLMLFVCKFPISCGFLPLLLFLVFGLKC